MCSPRSSGKSRRKIVHKQWTHCAGGKASFNYSAAKKKSRAVIRPFNQWPVDEYEPVKMCKFKLRSDDSTPAEQIMIILNVNAPITQELNYLLLQWNKHSAGWITLCTASADSPIGIITHSRFFLSLVVLVVGFFFKFSYKNSTVPLTGNNALKELKLYVLKEPSMFSEINSRRPGFSWNWR